MSQAIRLQPVAVKTVIPAPTWTIRVLGSLSARVTTRVAASYADAVAVARLLGVGFLGVDAIILFGGQLVACVSPRTGLRVVNSRLAGGAS